MPSFLEWLKGRFEPRPKRDALLDHFLIQMRDVALYAQSPTGEDAVVNQTITQRVAGLLDAQTEKSWDTAYEAERLLVFLRPRTNLAIEVDRRVAEAEGLKIAESAKYRAQLKSATDTLAAAKTAATAAEDAAASATDANRAQLEAAVVLARARFEQAKPQTDSQLRAVLTAVLDDLQWLYQKRILVRNALWGSATNLLCVGAMAMTAVAVPFMLYLFSRVFHTDYFLRLFEGFPNYGLYTAVSFGFLGAFFSRLISLKLTSDLTVEDAENLFGYRSLLIRGAVGMFGALIVYFLLGTDLLGQTLKPKYGPALSFTVADVMPVFSAKNSLMVLVPSPDWCLLIVWSFLAGFSEKLVPDSLGRAEKQLSGNGQ